MASSNALLTGLTGLQVNSRQLEVIGNNISNANTVSYKSNRLLFAPALSRNLSLGSGPSGVSGGTNPNQIGLGVNIAGSQRNTSGGAISTTGVSTDMAIEGNGFFVVQRNGVDYFTRAGAFQLNADRELVTIGGDRVMGYAIDQDFRVIDGPLTTLSIPVGVMTIAEATQNAFFQGNLNAAEGGEATQGGVITFDQAFMNLTGPAPMTGGDTIVDNLEDPSNPGNPLFPAAGAPYDITISGAMKGNRTLPDVTFTIGATTTVNDLIQYFDEALGIVTTNTNPDGSTPGAQIDAAGAFTIVSNAGSDNTIRLSATNITISDGAGDPVANPLDLTLTQESDGESVTTSMIVFDSLGTPLNVNVTMVFENADDTGTSWRYYVESKDNSDPTNPTPSLGAGVINFDTEGRLMTTAPVSIGLGRAGTGANNPLVFDLHFDSAGGSVTALADPDPINGSSQLTSRFQDGVPLGTLANFSVSEDGMITGAFTNGRTRVLGQVAVAAFTNPAGLIDSGNALYFEGPNSGTAIITRAGEFGTGRMVGGALELSNVDLGQEFINMILTTTGYSASSRVITKADELLQQLTALAR